MRQGTRTFYRLTPEGRAVWSRHDQVALPPHYRRVLGLVEFSGHREVIRGHLARHPDHVVDGWLRDFEALNLIEAMSVEPPELSALAAKAPPALEDEEQERIAADARLAGISLSRVGVYVDHERVAHRPPSRKAPKHTLALVVEDDPDQLALAVLRLTDAGYRVHSAASGAALIESLRKDTPDALFLDVVLPDGDGFDLLTALRQHPSYARLPIVMLTAKAEPQDIARGLALGADAYVTKPYGRNTLDYALRYVLQQQLAEPTPAASPSAPAQERKPAPDSDSLKSREDVRALLAEVAVRREAQETRGASRWRTVKNVVLALALAVAALQYYMMDVLTQIVSLQQTPVFVPVTARDQRSALETSAFAS